MELLTLRDGVNTAAVDVALMRLMRPPRTHRPSNTRFEALKLEPDTFDARACRGDSRRLRLRDRRRAERQMGACTLPFGIAVSVTVCWWLIPFLIAIARSGNVADCMGF